MPAFVSATHALNADELPFLIFQMKMVDSNFS
jgi:hypothetical protein